MFAPTNAPTQMIVPRRRWGLRIAIILVTMVVLVWAAPMFVAWSPLVAWACQQAESYVDGTVTVGSVSLGWFSPVVIYNLEVQDREKHPILQVRKIVGDRSLISLLLNHEEFGSIRLERPTLDWVFDGDQSNLERMLARVCKIEAETPTGEALSLAAVLPHGHFDIVDGVLAVRDVDNDRSWRATGLNLNVLVLNDPVRSVHVNVQGSLHDGSESGGIKADIHLESVGEAHPKLTVKGRFSSFPLKLANVLVRRFNPDTIVSGSLQGHCHLVVGSNADGPTVDLSGELLGNNVWIQAPFLTEDLYLERVTAPCRLTLENQTLAVEQAEIETDLGNAKLHGTFDLRQEGLAVLDQPRFSLAVDVNLAILADRLARTLRIHEDLRLTTGQVNFRCKSEAGNDGPVWTGSLHSTDIRGVKGSQTISWPEPIQVSFEARHISQGIPLIDRLSCTARFLTIEAAATPDRFTLNADADLKQLIEPLSEFIEVDSLKIAGQAKMRLAIQRLEKDRFALEGNADFKQVQLTWFTPTKWAEDSIVAKFDAQGQFLPGGGQRIDTAGIDVKLGGDLAQLKLLEPIANVSAGPWSAVSLRIDGDLSRWESRARAWTTALHDWQLAGQASVQMNLRPTSEGMDISSAVVLAKNLRCTGPMLSIQEPTLTMQTSGSWRADTGRLDLRETKLICPASSITARELTVVPVTGSMQGVFDFTGDLVRLRQWTLNTPTKDNNPVAGLISGRLDLRTERHQINADLNSSIKNFVYGPLTDPVWTEAEAQVIAQASYDGNNDVLRIERVNVVGTVGSVTANGTITHATTTLNTDLSGSIAYDLEKMEPQLRSLLGKDARIAGKNTRPFQLVGPIYPQSKADVLVLSFATPTLPRPRLQLTELQGEAGFRWTSLKAQGCDVGPADVKTVLQQGWFQMYPIETTINGGRLRLQPNIRLDPAPVEMILLAGKVIDRASITPEMCAGALAYSMPLLANVAEVDGVVSLTLDGGRIPLGSPRTAEVKGTFTLHSAKVGANAILRELSGVLKMPLSTSLIKDCPVAFHMRNGQVHHRNLVLEFPEMTLKSSGAVGLDGSLAIVIEMPIPPRFASFAKLTPAQANEVIRIPIGGTLDHPRIDPRALESLTATMGRSIFDNQLNRVLQPSR